MVVRTVAGHAAGETVADLQAWLRELTGGPDITDTVGIACDNAAHDGEGATWFYIEADARAAVARRRCLSCGATHELLDSAEHWTHPRMWACSSCSQSIAELAAGLHVETGADGERVTWVAIGARCVECGGIEGLTDFSVSLPRDAAVAAL